jgi:AraC family transcriptional regulator
MKEDNSKIYSKSLYKSIIYIQNNLESELNLEDIAEEAGYSLSHFHRIFKTIVGESIKSYIRRLRLENAAFRLGIKKESILDIAMDSGFYTHETFSRAFSKYFGELPSKYTNNITLENDSNITNIEKVYFKGRTCIFKRHLGDYTTSGTPYEKDSLWQNILVKSNLESKKLWDYEIYGISHDDPSITSSENIRYDACIAIKENYKTNITNQKLQEGLYIVATYKGAFIDLINSYNYLIYRWLNLYNFTINHNLPPFEQYFCDYIKIYIPILEKE